MMVSEVIYHTARRYHDAKNNNYFTQSTKAGTEKASCSLRQSVKWKRRYATSSEVQVVAELVKALVKENASTVQSQETYLKIYEDLTKRYEKARSELARLQGERTRRSQRNKAMALYIRTLKKQPNVLTEWNDTIWTVMVEKAIVHRDKSITFVFYNGSEVKVEEQR